MATPGSFLASAYLKLCPCGAHGWVVTKDGQHSKEFCCGVEAAAQVSAALALKHIDSAEAYWLGLVIDASPKLQSKRERVCENIQHLVDEHNRRRFEEPQLYAKISGEGSPDLSTILTTDDCPHRASGKFRLEIGIAVPGLGPIIAI